jgi:hypothetical protein
MNDCTSQRGPARACAGLRGPARACAGQRELTRADAGSYESQTRRILAARSQSACSAIAAERRSTTATTA